MNGISHYLRIVLRSNGHSFLNLILCLCFCYHFFLDFLCHHFFFGILSPDDFFQFGYLVQFLRREIQVAFNAQSSYLHAFHFIEGHIAKLPAVTHRNRTETDAGLGVILQEVSRISSHREEIACIGYLIANEFLFRRIEFRQLLPDTVGHEVIGIVYALVFSLCLLCFFFPTYGNTQLAKLFLCFCLSLCFCHRYTGLI